MSELPAVTGREAIRAFARFGFVEDRVRGSHHVLKKPEHPFLLTVPVHGKKPLTKGTLKSLLRAAELSVEQFVEALGR